MTRRASRLGKNIANKAGGCDPLLWIIPLLLSGIGIVMIISLTSGTTLGKSLSTFLWGIRQVCWLMVGLSAMFLMYMVPLNFWRRIGGGLWMVSFILILVTFLPGVGVEVGGAQRWIRIGSIAFQPLELLVFSLVIHLSAKLDSSVDSKRTAFKMTLFILIISIMPVLKQPDLGGSIMLFLVVMGIYIERYGWLYPVFTGTMLSPLLVFLVYKASYRMRRITAWLHPWQDPFDSGFQIIQGLIAFSNGGFWGTGIGRGLQKSHYLPAAHTDYIFAAVGEELGLAGTLTITLMFLLWTFRILRSYLRIENRWHKSLLWGTCISVIIPFFINVGGVTNFIPLTGMPLPFISYGGSSLVMMWTRVGLVMRVLKENRKDLHACVE